jgi:hypothetical protein
MNWRSMLDYVPRFHVLIRGWLEIKFKIEEDLAEVSSHK